MELLFIVLLLTVCTMTSSTNTLSPSCQAKCGDIAIPYPFGIGDGCYANDYPGNFKINCTDKVAYLDTGNVEVINISVGGEVRIKTDTGYDCYDRGVGTSSFTPAFSLAELFTFSYTKNKFVVIGCDTFAYLNGEEGVSYSGGCMSLCANLDGFSDVPNDSCSGLGCCEVSIPGGLTSFSTQVGSFHNYTRTATFNRCGYIFLAEKGAYEFNVADLNSTKLQMLTLPLILDWSIRNMNCTAAKNNLTVPYACISNNSTCVDSDNGVGYLCYCTQGYEGNPYLKGGCTGTSKMHEMRFFSSLAFLF